METFKIGGKAYPVNITYRVKQIFTMSYSDQEKIKEFKQADHENVYVQAAFKSLIDKPFETVDAMLDVLGWDEYDDIEKFFRDMINRKLEGLTEIEKKQIM